MGEKGISVSPPIWRVTKANTTAYRADDIQLARFKGRPGEMSPKARIWMFAGWLMPSRFKYVSVIYFQYAMLMPPMQHGTTV